MPELSINSERATTTDGRLSTGYPKPDQAP
jgi:hypothetical protein